MGTHPIFESDFDCLTELSADILRINRRLMKLIVRPDDNPVLLLSSVFSKTVKSVENGKESKLILNSGSEVTHVPTMARFLARNSKPNLYGDDLRCQGEVDHFLRFGQRLNFSRDASQLNKTLLSRTFLTGQEVTVADYLVYAYLRDNAVWNSEKKDEFTNLIRWFGHIGSQKSVKVGL